MRKIKTSEAVGMVLCHDVTKIVPGEFKGPAFKKGHVVKEEDVPELLKIGKENLYVWECDKNSLHENDAAIRICEAAAGKNLFLTQPKEGRVNLKSAQRGLLKINVEVLSEINAIEEVTLATRHTNIAVEKEETVAGCRVIPLIIKQEKVEQVEEICAQSGPVIEIKPYRQLKTGIITTGNEVYSGRITDCFGPMVRDKLENIGCPVIRHDLLSDNSAQIATKIKEQISQGAEMVVVTGGMSVDPDDATPGGVKQTGAQIITYGTPLFPGAMFLLAYLDNVPILGLPGCVMYHQATVFDIILPRIVAGETVTRTDITRLGHGGLCLDCPTCRFPHCSFGKG
ncbi:molybdopterin-binding protein [Dethiobacter alkaliphilus]|uniref:Molybdopterin molybdenumtransferase n=1 Tax=Dethiobacter alkaliphilus AHT 1 TaxID=555088 RepID=C0GH13_DETAL|nr:molybdopterin-binding protein [Dethiobacter alkaliphilus]EEG77315.1 molybdopterin binding domain protein [Dethiobacter alkaliphilus AHT 1]